MMLVVLTALLWSLVEVHCQTFPHVSFMGQTLDNHSYVDLTLVGDVTSGSNPNTVQCHTDLATCCSGAQGVHRGDWYFPDGSRLGFAAMNIYEGRGPQTVHLLRRNANSPVGIYRCGVTTNAVHDDNDESVRDSPVYVGLYTTSGGIIE